MINLDDDTNNFKKLVHLGLNVISSDDIEQQILSPLSCLREYESKWILEFDLPLVEKEHISITLDSGNKIIVEAKLKEKYYISNFHEKYEFNYFKKSVNLPDNIDEAKISAKFDNGRLVIIIPKTSKGNKIRIE
ncbi:MAG: Hsp20/alpha crystallin family protein [Crenarchaeota archaeon]|nr:MAG: Hsp20/alpha crystallin family protein [Thermoproteota archaeon]RDJ34581.1 MAG: Hsp20/alpha crystallin family protein [Thermoproteota archaeon]RDJ35898.1 MAG: Hsp20/alpha crystallin family protein [Thermoproteota archaeon]RDJ38475.1 MAG: Hsp20/alpha crystallin family protein [Thermoproteota archaeon]